MRGAVPADVRRAPARVAVLASGGGSNLQSLLDYFAEPAAAADARVVLVASNRAAAGALDRARACGVDAAVLRAAHRSAEEVEQRLEVGATAGGENGDAGGSVGGAHVSPAA